VAVKRAPGTGSITELKNPDGSTRGYWARLWVDGSKKSFGVHPTPEIAAGVLDTALHVRARRLGGAGSKITFADFAKDVLDLRETDGMRSVDDELNRFKVHLANSAIADLALAEITSADIASLGRELMKKRAKDRRESRKLARNTVKRILGVVSVVMNEAVEQGKRTDNPCIGVRLRGRKDEDEGNGTIDEWLRGHEQRAVMSCDEIPEWGRLLMQFAWGTGLREGEQWHALLADVHLPWKDGKCQCGARINMCSALQEHGSHVFVRHGSSKGGKQLGPKGSNHTRKKTRRVPLFGEGLEAITRWLEVLPTYAPNNPLGLVFPGPTGARRQPGPPSHSTWTVDKSKSRGGKVGKEYLLPIWLKVAGITRHVRWHDLRHTCASSLLSGTWGRKWTLDEVCKMLGHSSVKVTERYAHLCDSALRDAAAATGYAGVTGNGPGGDGMTTISNDFNGAPPRRIERPTNGLGRTSTPQRSLDVRSTSNPVITPDASAVSRAVLEAVARGDTTKALALAVTLAAGSVSNEHAKEKAG